MLGGCLNGSRRVRPSRNERVYQMVYPTRSKAIRDIASWIELEHTIRNDSTPPWGTGRPTRSRRSTEQQDKQPERPLSGLSETRPAVHYTPPVGPWSASHPPTRPLRPRPWVPQNTCGTLPRTISPTPARSPRRTPSRPSPPTSPTAPSTTTSSTSQSHHHTPILFNSSHI